MDLPRCRLDFERIFADEQSSNNNINNFDQNKNSLIEKKLNINLDKLKKSSCTSEVEIDIMTDFAIPLDKPTGFGLSKKTERS